MQWHWCLNACVSVWNLIKWDVKSRSFWSEDYSCWDRFIHRDSWLKDDSSLSHRLVCSVSDFTITNSSMSLLLNWLLKKLMTSTSSPMHSGAFNFESKFQNNLFTSRMAIQCRRRNGNTINPNLYSDGTFMMNPSMFDVSMQNGSLKLVKIGYGK